jgi:hypothetical protein
MPCSGVKVLSANTNAAVRPARGPARPPPARGTGRSRQTARRSAATFAEYPRRQRVDHRNSLEDVVRLSHRIGRAALAFRQPAEFDGRQQLRGGDAGGDQQRDTGYWPPSRPAHPVRAPENQRQQRRQKPASPADAQGRRPRRTTPPNPKSLRSQTPMPPTAKRSDSGANPGRGHSRPARQPDAASPSTSSAPRAAGSLRHRAATAETEAAGETRGPAASARSAVEPPTGSGPRAESARCATPGPGTAGRESPGRPCRSGRTRRTPRSA